MLWFAASAFSLPSAEAQQSRPKGVVDRLLYEADRLMSRGDFVNARVLLLRAQKLEPNNASVYKNLARTSSNNIERLSDGFVEAERFLKKSISLNPKDAHTYSQLAELNVTKGDFQEALKYADISIKLAPDFNEGYFCRALALSNLKRYGEAVKSIDKYIEYSVPKDKIKGLDTKASILENGGLHKDALAVYRSAYAISKQDTYLYRQASCLEKDGKYNEAIQVLNGQLRINPHDDQAMVQRARIYNKAGQTEKALADYTAAIKELPASIYFKERGAIYKKLGRSDLFERDMKAAANI
jgi:tetratricopeptide (TPR) repeat protein